MAIVNNVADWSAFQVSVSVPLDIFSEMELLDHMVVLFLIFQGTSVMFSIVAVPICTPSNIVPEFLFLHTHTSVCYLFFDDGILIGNISLWF